jgi:VIT1/CCC1 family predicted Fe2+/Mn2+ transporter
MTKSFFSLETVHNIIIGMSDGLTVPFALAAGIASTTTHNIVIIIAGISSIVAGMISMGLGGFLATKSDVDYYKVKQKIESTESIALKEQEDTDIFASYGLTASQVAPITKAFEANPKQWVNFIMLNAFQLSKPTKNEALNSGVVVGLSYLISGFIPLSPYFFMKTPYQALFVSIIVTFVTLVAFGYLKARAIGSNIWSSIFGVVAVSGVAAALAFVIGRLFN